MAISHQIQEFRCRIAPKALINERVMYLAFPYQQALNTFLEQMAGLLKTQRRTLSERDLPPFRSLNKLLTALTPSLVHPFITYALDTATEKPTFERRMMVFEQSFRPSFAQLEQVTRVWARRWVESRFKEEKETSLGQAAFAQLLHQLSQPQASWKTVNANALLRDPQNTLVYKAIPSLLAARLVGQESEIHGRVVTWQLTQEPGTNRFALVSQPMRSFFYDPRKDKNIEGYFAYHVEFGVQTVPGDPQPFVHISISCRRYVEAQLESLLYQRRSTVMVGTQTPRLDTWSAEPTLVPISIRGNGQDYKWDDEVPELLYDLRARPLEKVERIVADPQAYWEPHEITGDRYFLLHSEGIEPDHPLETGFGPVELHAVWQAVLALCQGVLIPDQPVMRDQETQRLDRTLSMVPIWELNERKRVTTFIEGKKKQRDLSIEAKQDLGSEALQRTGVDLPLTILPLYRTERVRDEIMNDIQSCALWQCQEITLSSAYKIDDALVAPLDHGNMDPNFRTQNKHLPRKDREAQKAEWERLVELGRRQRVKAWRDFLATIRPEKGTVLALIELPPESVAYEDLNPHAAIREACVREGIGSQMLISFRNGKIADQSRAKSALADLLVRQMGLFYGDIQDMYLMAGLSPEQADQMTVVGICRVRRTKHALDYVVAVRVLPNGRVEMLLPREGEQWQPYQKGCLALAEIFRTAPPHKDKRGKKELKLNEIVIRRFLRDVCLSTEEPQVVFVGAQDFRSVWKQLQNPKMVLNQLAFAPTDMPIEPDVTPPLWIIRLREYGSLDETPQYVQLMKGPLSESDDAHYAEGLYDLGSSGKFHVYHSIGRGPGSGDRREWQKEERGGSRAFKHQHVLETIPFFLSDENTSFALARMTYFFRFSPSWELGTTLFPLPNHLGYAAIDDYECLLPSVEEPEEI